MHKKPSIPFNHLQKSTKWMNTGRNRSLEGDRRVEQKVTTCSHFYQRHFFLCKKTKVKSQSNFTICISSGI